MDLEKIGGSAFQASGVPTSRDDQVNFVAGSGNDVVEWIISNPTRKGKNSAFGGPVQRKLAWSIAAVITLGTSAFTTAQAAESD